MSNQYTIPSNSPYFNSSQVNSQYTNSTPAANSYTYPSNNFDNRFVQQHPSQYHSYQYANNYFEQEASSEKSSSYDQVGILLIDNACSNYTNEYKGESKDGYKTPNNSPAEIENEMTDEIYIAPLSFPIPIPQQASVQKNSPHSASQAPRLTPAQSPLNDIVGDFSLPSSTPAFSYFTASNNQKPQLSEVEQQMRDLNLNPSQE